MTTLNFNIGVLGHVDSGKTSLAKALSTVASTACFDKNPQSKQRGITLDLGFSSFTIQASDELKAAAGYEYVQYTLVDCPGHASLIKTIIGGAQIIDMFVLVIDIVKGVQTQTAECLIIGEICCDKMLIVLNKLDLIEESKREAAIEKMTKRLLKTLEPTKFANSPIVAVSASPQDAASSQPKEDVSQAVEGLSLSDAKPSPGLNMDVLIEKLKQVTFLPKRVNVNGPFLFAVDHCFTIKGQGTIMTGTVLEGQVKVNDNVEVPSFKQQKKVKSVQIFRKPVDKAVQGDRCGICVANFDSKQFERGVVCAPNHVRSAYAVIINLNKIRHFKNSIESGSKFHITIGHETLIGKIELFGLLNTPANAAKDLKNQDRFDFSSDYIYLSEYHESEKQAGDAAANKENIEAAQDEQGKKAASKQYDVLKYYALIDFTNENELTSSVLCTPNNLLIGSKLDTDIHLNQCRIAFHGKVLHMFSNKDFKEKPAATGAPAAAAAASDNFYLSDLRVYKEKQKEGVVERKQDEYTLIGKALFKKETNIDLFVGLKVVLSTGERGTIEGSFGQSGKFKIRLSDGLSKTTSALLDAGGKKGKAKAQEPAESQNDNASDQKGAQIKVYLDFKRYIYDEKKRMIQ